MPMNSPVTQDLALGPATLREIAEELAAARREGWQIEPPSRRFAAFDVAAGYAVAALNHAAALAAGATPVGRKIGFTNPAMWARFGVGEPIWGFMYDRTVFPVGAGEARCSLRRLCEPMIEPEIVFRLRAAPPPQAGIAGLLAAVDWVALGFEVVQAHFPGWRFAAADTIADGALHAALYVGAPLPPAALGDDPAAALAGFSLDLLCDGEQRGSGRGADVLGSPLAALGHLCQVLARQPQLPPLAAGELVSTGTITTALPVAAGQRWRVACDGITLAAPGLTFEA